LKLVKGMSFSDIYESASKPVRNLISKGLQASIRCGTHKGVEMILDHCVYKKIQCVITEKEVTQLLESQNYSVMQVLLLNGVGYLTRVATEDESEALSQERSLKRILKVPTLLQEVHSNPQHEGCSFAERKLTPSCFVEQLVDPNQLGTIKQGIFFIGKIVH